MGRVEKEGGNERAPLDVPRRPSLIDLSISDQRRCWWLLLVLGCLARVARVRGVWGVARL